jgi:hypothetical protein
MKTNLIVTSLYLLAGTAILTGCSKSGANSGMLDESKVASTVTQAFAKAPADTKEEATTCVAAVEGADTSLAFTQLQRMSTETNLTGEQRQVLARAMQATFKKLQTAAQNGDATADKTVHSYLSSR